MSLGEPAIPGLPNQESYAAPDTAGFAIESELDTNVYALAIAAKTIKFLTCNLRGAESDVESVAKLAEKRLHTDHVVSYDGYALGEREVDRYIAAVLDHVVETEWFRKHGTTAMYIADLDPRATIKWVEDGAKETMLVNGVPQKRVAARNAEVYRAYRVVRHPEAALCNVALGVSNTFQTASYTASNAFEMHIEKTITASAACDHAKTLAAAVRLLRSL